MLQQRLRDVSGGVKGANTGAMMLRTRKGYVASTPKDQTADALRVSDVANGDFGANSPSTISNSSLVAANNFAVNERRSFERGYEAVYAEKLVVHTIENIITKPPAIAPFPFRSGDRRYPWLWIFGIPLLALILLALLYSSLDDRGIVPPVSLPLLNKTVEIISIKKFYHYFVPSPTSSSSGFTSNLSSEDIKRLEGLLSAINSRLTDVEDTVKRLNAADADGSNGMNIVEDIRHLKQMFASVDQRMAGLETSPAANPPNQHASSQIRSFKEQLLALQSSVDSLENERQSWKSRLDEVLSKNRIYQSELNEINLRLESLRNADCNCPPTFVPQGGVNKEIIDKLITEAINRYDADKTGLPDYALEPAGGSIINTRCTESYPSNTRRHYFFGFLRLPFWPNDYTPRVVIQPDLTPGECWAFQGARGYLVIKLSGTIQVTAVSYEHIPKEISPDGHIHSAPRKFEVAALSHETDQNGTLLGTFHYNQDGPALQYFPVQARDASPTEIVEMRVLSNHGHPQYTCLYRLRVHGKRVNDGWPTFGGS